MIRKVDHMGLMGSSVLSLCLVAMLMHPPPPSLLPLLLAIEQTGPPEPAERTGSPAPSVEFLVGLALQNAPLLKAQEARWQAARRRVAPSKSLPNPMFEVMWQDVNFPDFTVGREEMSMVSLEIQQGLPLLGKLRAMAGSAEAQAEVMAAEILLLQRSVASQVRILYAQIYALDSEKRLLTLSRDLLDLMSATVQSRYVAGESNQEALIKSQLEVFRLDERWDDLSAERRAKAAELARWTGVPTEEVPGEVQGLPEIQGPGESWVDVALMNAPEIAMAHSLLAAGERKVEVAKFDLLPEPYAGYTLGIREELDPVVSLRLGVEYPMWQLKEKKMLVRAEELEVEALQRDLEDREAQIRAEAARLSAQWDRDQGQIHRYREAILPETSAAMDAARSSYLVGQGDFSAVLEDFREWLDARAGLAQREADRFMTWSEIQTMVEPLERAAP